MKCFSCISKTLSLEEMQKKINDKLPLSRSDKWSDNDCKDVLTNIKKGKYILVCEMKPDVFPPFEIFTEYSKDGVKYLQKYQKNISNMKVYNSNDHWRTVRETNNKESQDSKKEGHTINQQDSESVIDSKIKKRKIASRRIRETLRMLKAPKRRD